MHKLTRLLFLAVALTFFCGAANAMVPLIDPAPILIPTGTEQKVVVKAIKQALAGRDWRVTEEQSGKLNATINVRNKHTANIQFDYDANRISIKYVSSDNLDYVVRDNEPKIHRNYIRWINLLVEDISRNLAVAQIP